MGITFKNLPNQLKLSLVWIILDATQIVEKGHMNAFSLKASQCSVWGSLKIRII